MSTFHAWGFLDSAGGWRPLVGVAATTETAHKAFCRLQQHLYHHGGEIEGLKVTRTLDGAFVGAEFETAPRQTCARMWHIISATSNPWPDPPATQPAPTEAEGATA